jgi:hypothetical protein
VPAQSIPPIRHGQQPGGFLSSGIVRALDTSGRDWQGGISFFQSCDVIGGIHTCAGGEKDPTVYGEEVTFDPFIIYNLQECSGFAGEGIEAVSVENFRRVEQRQVAGEIHSGAVTGNPSFQSAAVDQTGATIEGLTATLFALIDLVCEKGISELVLHAPFHSIPLWLASDLAVWDPISGQYRLGHIPIIFDCYPNVGPDTPSVESGNGPNDVAAADEIWVYATGPIEFTSGTVHQAAAFDHHINQHVDLNERLAIYRFDTCSVLAAKASVCIEACPTPPE